jgi:hypothetical protein
MKIFYFIAAHFFYFLGDLFSKIPFYLFCVLYNNFMKVSYDFDEKIGFKIWKKP